MTTLNPAIRLETAQVLARSSWFANPLQLLLGAFFALRICVTYVAFQDNPRAGTGVVLGLGGCLFVLAMFCTLGDEQSSLSELWRNPTLRWLTLYIAVCGLSLLWTASDSPLIAAGYWAGMAADVATVLLLVKGQHPQRQVEVLMAGFVAGAAFVALLAWLSPTQSDLRLGDLEFLHPNAIGLVFALAFFFAQHLAQQNRAWKWFCLALGISLLRTISKTCIVAFVVAEIFYLVRERDMSRWAKVRICAAASIVVAAFWGLLETYLSNYTSAGTQAETLTGRTLIWATSFSMALDHPWLGSGLYSYRTVIPAFGNFEPMHAHDELLHQFFELGLLGVGVTIGLYASLILAARRSCSLQFKSLALVVAVFAVIHGVADTVNFGLSLPLWLFGAFAVVLAQPTSRDATPMEVQS